ncbi:unnamed protein product [Owenia fusiformis]|uniref:Mammalian ependymin-related protein 1 n=1 Tax=Owenia fusiformis TaxID=6347 RepID=A0A8S4PF18_OWEFU|nr:unnamed protein product [Owenia fusiformis]
MKIFLFLGLIAAVYSQAARRCETPKQWEAVIIRHDHTDDFSSRAKLSYDAFGERSRETETVYMNGKEAFYDILRLHKERVEFVVDIRTKKCERRELTYPFRPFEIPENARSYGEAYIGGSLLGSGVLINQWEANMPNDAKWTGQWAIDGCIPVYDHYWHNYVNYTSYHFYDVTLGISDPNVFIPPSTCK